jgi:hypothetical protein
VKLTFRGFKIYYGDGTVFRSDNEADWDVAPGINVQVVIVYYNETFTLSSMGVLETYPFRTLLHGEDYFWRWGTGMLDIPKDATIKLGQLLDTPLWFNLYNAALADTEF